MVDFNNFFSQICRLLNICLSFFLIQNVAVTLVKRYIVCMYTRITVEFFVYIKKIVNIYFVSNDYWILYLEIF